jgi:hypothetical protein
VEKHGMRDYEYDFSAGASSQWDSIQGNSFNIIRASGDVTLKFNGGTEVTRTQGAYMQVGEYTSVEIISNIPQVILISFGYGVSSTPQTEFTGAVTAVMEQPNAPKSSADITIGAGLKSQVVLANLQRKKLTIQSLDSNDVNVRVGDANVSASRGGILAVGGSFETDCTGVFYVFNPSANAVVLAIYEEELTS